MPYLPPCLVLYPTSTPGREHNYQFHRDATQTRGEAREWGLLRGDGSGRCGGVQGVWPQRKVRVGGVVVNLLVTQLTIFPRRLLSLGVLKRELSSSIGEESGAAGEKAPQDSSRASSASGPPLHAVYLEDGSTEGRAVLSYLHPLRDWDHLSFSLESGICPHFFFF